MSQRPVREVVRHCDDAPSKWCVYSHDGSKKLGGPYDTKEEGTERLGQIEFFKKQKGAIEALAALKGMTLEEVLSTSDYEMLTDETADKKLVPNEPAVTTDEGDYPEAGEPQEPAPGPRMCVCPECGTKLEKEAKSQTPCRELKCPKCGAQMQPEAEKAEKEAFRVQEWRYGAPDKILPDHLEALADRELSGQPMGAIMRVDEYPELDVLIPTLSYEGRRWTATRRKVDQLDQVTFGRKKKNVGQLPEYINMESRFREVSRLIGPAQFITEFAKAHEISPGLASAWDLPGRLHKFAVWGDIGRGKAEVAETSDDLNYLQNKYGPGLSVKQIGAARESVALGILDTIPDGTTITRWTDYIPLGTPDYFQVEINLEPLAALDHRFKRRGPTWYKLTKPEQLEQKKQMYRDRFHTLMTDPHLLDWEAERPPVPLEEQVRVRTPDGIGILDSLGPAISTVYFPDRREFQQYPNTAIGVIGAELREGVFSYQGHRVEVTQVTTGIWAWEVLDPPVGVDSEYIRGALFGNEGEARQAATNAIDNFDILMSARRPVREQPTEEITARRFHALYGEPGLVYVSDWVDWLTKEGFDPNSYVEPSVWAELFDIFAGSGTHRYQAARRPVAEHVHRCHGCGRTFHTQDGRAGGLNRPPNAWAWYVERGRFHHKYCDRCIARGEVRGVPFQPYKYYSKPYGRYREARRSRESSVDFGPVMVWMFANVHAYPDRQDFIDASLVHTGLKGLLDEIDLAWLNEHAKRIRRGAGIQEARPPQVTQPYGRYREVLSLADRDRLRAKQDQVIALAKRLGYDETLQIAQDWPGAPWIGALRYNLFPEFEDAIDYAITYMKRGLGESRPAREQYYAPAPAEAATEYWMARMTAMEWLEFGTQAIGDWARGQAIADAWGVYTYLRPSVLERSEWVDIWAEFVQDRADLFETARSAREQFYPPNHGKSMGHIKFAGKYEYFTGPDGNVYRASLTSVIDPASGYRKGGRFFAIPSAAEEMLAMVGDVREATWQALDHKGNPITSVLADSEEEAKTAVRHQLSKNPSRRAYLKSWGDGGEQVQVKAGRRSVQEAGWGWAQLVQVFKSAIDGSMYRSLDFTDYEANKTMSVQISTANMIVPDRGVLQIVRRAIAGSGWAVHVIGVDYPTARGFPPSATWFVFEFTPGGEIASARSFRAQAGDVSLLNIINWMKTNAQDYPRVGKLVDRAIAEYGVGDYIDSSDRMWLEEQAEAILLSIGIHPRGLGASRRVDRPSRESREADLGPTPHSTAGWMRDQWGTWSLDQFASQHWGIGGGAERQAFVQWANQKYLAHVYQDLATWEELLSNWERDRDAGFAASRSSREVEIPKVQYEDKIVFLDRWGRDQWLPGTVIQEIHGMDQIHFRSDVDGQDHFVKPSEYGTTWKLLGRQPTLLADRREVAPTFGQRQVRATWHVHEKRGPLGGSEFAVWYEDAGYPHGRRTFQPSDEGSAIAYIETLKGQGHIMASWDSTPTDYRELLEQKEFWEFGASEGREARRTRESQLSFNPVDFTFRWTDDWYEWDYSTAHQQARQARDAKARELRALGHKVRSWTLPNQRTSRGGIGSGKPHIDLMVTVYMINYEARRTREQLPPPPGMMTAMYWGADLGNVSFDEQAAFWNMVIDEGHTPWDEAQPAIYWQALYNKFHYPSYASARPVPVAGGRASRRPAREQAGRVSLSELAEQERLSAEYMQDFIVWMENIKDEGTRQYRPVSEWAMFLEEFDEYESQMRYAASSRRPAREQPSPFGVRLMPRNEYLTRYAGFAPTREKRFIDWLWHAKRDSGNTERDLSEWVALSREFASYMRFGPSQASRRTREANKAIDAILFLWRDLKRDPRVRVEDAGGVGGDYIVVTSLDENYSVFDIGDRLQKMLQGYGQFPGFWVELVSQMGWQGTFRVTETPPHIASQRPRLLAAQNVQKGQDVFVNLPGRWGYYKARVTGHLLPARESKGHRPGYVVVEMASGGVKAVRPELVFVREVGAIPIEEWMALSNLSTIMRNRFLNYADYNRLTGGSKAREEWEHHYNNFAQNPAWNPQTASRRLAQVQSAQPVVAAGAPGVTEWDGIRVGDTVSYHDGLRSYRATVTGIGFLADQTPIYHIQYGRGRTARAYKHQIVRGVVRAPHGESKRGLSTAYPEPCDSEEYYFSNWPSGSRAEYGEWAQWLEGKGIDPNSQSMDPEWETLWEEFTGYEPLASTRRRAREVEWNVGDEIWFKVDVEGKGVVIDTLPPRSGIFPGMTRYVIANKRRDSSPWHPQARYYSEYNATVVFAYEDQIWESARRRGRAAVGDPLVTVGDKVYHQATDYTGIVTSIGSGGTETWSMDEYIWLDNGTQARAGSVRVVTTAEMNRWAMTARRRVGEAAYTVGLGVGMQAVVIDGPFKGKRGLVVQDIVDTLVLEFPDGSRQKFSYRDLQLAESARHQGESALPTVAVGDEVLLRGDTLYGLTGTVTEVDGGSALVHIPNVGERGFPVSDLMRLNESFEDTPRRRLRAAVLTMTLSDFAEREHISALELDDWVNWLIRYKDMGDPLYGARTEGEWLALQDEWLTTGWAEAVENVSRHPSYTCRMGDSPVPLKAVALAFAQTAPDEWKAEHNGRTYYVYQAVLPQGTWGVEEFENGVMVDEASGLTSSAGAKGWAESKAGGIIAARRTREQRGDEEPYELPLPEDEVDDLLDQYGLAVEPGPRRELANILYDWAEFAVDAHRTKQRIRDFEHRYRVRLSGLVQAIS